MSAERDDCEGRGLKLRIGGSVGLGWSPSGTGSSGMSVRPGMSGSGLGGIGDGSPQRCFDGKRYDERWKIRLRTYTKFKVRCGGCYDDDFLRCRGILKCLGARYCEGDTPNDHVMNDST